MNKQIPTDLKEGYFIKIPQKGNLVKCAKYAGITLPSVPENVFIRPSLNHMKGSLDL